MKTRRSPRNRHSAFTLLEVLAVFAILVILASVATFATVRYLGDAKKNQATLQMQNIQKAGMSYYTSTSAYPDSLQALVQASQSGPPLLEGGNAAITDPWGKAYQTEVVTDDYGGERYVVFTTDETGKRMQWPRN